MCGCDQEGGEGVCDWQRSAKNGDAERMASCAANRRFSAPTLMRTIGDVDGVGELLNCHVNYGVG